MAGQPTPLVQESHGATIRDHGPVDQGPRQAGASLRPPWRPRLPEEGDAEDTQVHHPAILPVDVRPYGSRLLLARPDDRCPAAGVGRVLVVQLWEETVAPSPVYRVPGVGPPDQGAVAEGQQGLWVGAPEGAGAAMAVEG